MTFGVDEMYTIFSANGYPVDLPYDSLYEATVRAAFMASKHCDGIVIAPVLDGVDEWRVYPVFDNYPLLRSIGNDHIMMIKRA